MSQWMSKWRVLGAAAMMFALGTGCATDLGKLATSVEDDAIVVAVRERLAADPVTQRYSIGVTSQRGYVVLSGSLPIEARARALSIARGTEGVRAVEDRMVDRPYASQLTPSAR